MQPVSLEEFKLFRDPLQQEGHEDHLVLSREIGVKVTKLPGVLDALVGRDLDADQHHLRAGSLAR